MEWKELLPYLSQQIELGNVWVYDASGITGTLTKKQQDKVNELECEFERVKVVAVIDASYRFPDEIIMHFNTYLMIGDDSIPEVCNDGIKDYVAFIAYVDNLEDSSCSELGDVGVTEASGLLKRLY